MWFPLSLLAMSMLVARRSTEKTVLKNIDSLAMTWLQQAVALPFIILTLFFAHFYLPSELSGEFWKTMAVYVLCGAMDLYCYFKALNLADITYVAPMLALVSVGNIIGAYFVLGQKPTPYGIFGAILIIFGVYLINLAKRADKVNIKTNRTALLFILVLVVVRAFYSNIEVNMLRVSNPTSFNFYSSILTVPLILLLSLLIKNKRRAAGYWELVNKGVKFHIWPLVLIGLTYTINLTSTYAAKLSSPNAGYVGAVKSAQVLPMILIGIFFFKEKVSSMQVCGFILIFAGIVSLGLN